MLRTANSKDFKNVTFDALSFLFPMQLDERVLSSCDVTGLVKNTLSLCVRSVPFSTSISRSPTPAFVRTEIQSAFVFVRSGIQSAALFHRAIVTLQLFELTSRGFAVYLENLFTSIDEIGYFTFSNNSNVVPPSEARPNSIFIFNDVTCDKHDAVREYFSMGRHANVIIKPLRQIVDSPGVRAIKRQSRYNDASSALRHLKKDEEEMEEKEGEAVMITRCCHDNEMLSTIEELREAGLIIN
ncbi:hypothetical protein ALC57_01531 [Trachymyrmex cornetzi]|uniref:Uncharacterized protein n=1 Tax=Trachymyrmex cornetzi TaxID=471704 RepID=A0A151JPM5_9HYME|nr:hypothetical protein ALC57_01531 [Trachymyrmex cornetzi]